VEIDEEKESEGEGDDGVWSFQMNGAANAKEQWSEVEPWMNQPLN